MIAIPNMEKPKSCYNHCLEGFIANEEIGCPLKDYVESHQYKNKIHSDCPLIEIVTCGEYKWCDNKGKGRALICTNPYIDMDIHPLDFCSYGERRE